MRTSGRCPRWTRAVRSRAMVDAPEAPRDRVGRDEWLLLTSMAVIWLVMLAWTPGMTLQEDARRFIEIASAPGTPYRDFAVEYPPLETLLILLLGRGSDLAVVWRMALINGVSTVGCWWVLRRYWSRDIGALFLWFALPMQVFMPFRVDMLAVLVIVGGIVLADRRHTIAGGLLAAAGIVLRVWPAVVVPVFLLRRRPRAFVVSVLVTIVVGLWWVAVSGTDAVTQVSGYRGATGWQVESGPGVVDQIVHPSEPFRFEQGAVRVGSMLPWEMRSLRFVTIALVVAAWWLGSRRPIDPAGAPALAAVAVLLALSPVFSPQYVAWLLPWAAIVAAERRARDVRILMIGAGVFASLAIAVYIWDRYQLGLEVLSIGRMVCVVGLAVVGFMHKRVDAGVALEAAAAA
jgi:Glycosyltransferase family 87